MFNRICFGSLNYFLRYFSDLTFREFLILSILLSVLFFRGFFPNTIFDFVSAYVHRVLLC